MKDTRKPLFVSSLDGFINTSEGRITVPLLSYARFNEFVSTSPGLDGAFVADIKNSDSPYKVVQGIPDEAGAFSRATGNLTDFTIYGTTAYTDVSVEGTKLTVPMRHRNQ